MKRACAGGLALLLALACGTDRKVESTRGELRQNPAASTRDAAVAQNPCGDARDAGRCEGTDCTPGCQVSPAFSLCGNGVVDPLEECDDGNSLDGDSCSSRCLAEVCGNGRLDPGETCDSVTPDCSASCQLIPLDAGASTDAASSEGPARCGDGVLQLGEECDDGNLAYGDGCSPTCQVETCGNGRIEGPAEVCEPPGTAVCSQKCRIPRCGDGFVDALTGEECEDGNIDNGDGCSSTCRIERCGNGRLEPPEQCEPPGTAACDSNCRALSSAAPKLELPLGAERFRLGNPSFDGSLASWQMALSGGAQVQLSPVDLAGGVGQAVGAALLSVTGAGAVQSEGALGLVIGDPDGGGASIGQCVQTRAGSAYQLSLHARPPALVGLPLSLQMGARFQSNSDCSGPLLDGVTTQYTLNDTSDADLALPPPSPIAGGGASFAAPLGAGSMLVWVELVEQPGVATSVLLDSIVLERVSTPVCGDGIPDPGEECEPSVTPGCGTDCRLPRVCGDGLGTPEECSPGAAQPCPQDCPQPPPVCGDGIITPPEECEPPGQTPASDCSSVCTKRHALCGDGKVDSSRGEQCDPPNGVTCDADCHALLCAGASCPPPLPVDPCGDGVVDSSLGEQCDPPSYTNNCGPDCRRPVCGDGKLGGAEQCDPPKAGSCDASCRFPSDDGTCRACLASTCSGPAPAEDLYAACFSLEGVAEGGPAKGSPLRQLCAEAVDCLRRTSCDTERRPPHLADPLSCYCGKRLLETDQGDYAEALRACRDGLTEADGSCRAAFERAAESTLPGAVLAALDHDFGKPALTAALRLMTECGHNPGTPTAPRSCASACSVASSCGNGIVEDGEMCDPNDPEWGDNGARWPSDPSFHRPTCNPTYCSVLPCGNGVVDLVWPYGDADPRKPANWVPETCDPGDPYTASQCDTTCRVKTVCGDGKLTAAVEGCDPGPDGSWANCCRPDSTENLAGCDRNGNQRVDKEEGCVTPAVCGNGVREGIEECDPPATGSCDAQCHRIESGECAVCTQASCSTQYQACYDAEPSARAGCIEVVDCVETSKCVGNATGLLPCLCGDREGLLCQSQGGNGTCKDQITRHVGCDDTPSPACVYNDQNNVQKANNSTALALQLLQCRLDFCWDPCAPTLIAAGL